MWTVVYTGCMTHAERLIESERGSGITIKSQWVADNVVFANCLYRPYIVVQDNKMALFLIRLTTVISESMILKGSIERRYLKAIVENQMSLDSKLEYLGLKMVTGQQPTDSLSPPVLCSSPLSYEENYNVTPRVTKPRCLFRPCYRPQSGCLLRPG